MAETISTIFSSVGQFIAFEWRWLTPVIISIMTLALTFASYRRGKILELKEVVALLESSEKENKTEKQRPVKVDTRRALSWSQMKAIEDRRLASNIAHRSFLRNIVKGAATIWFISWLFSDDENEYEDE